MSKSGGGSGVAAAVGGGLLSVITLVGLLGAAAQDDAAAAAAALCGPAAGAIAGPLAVGSGPAVGGLNAVQSANVRTVIAVTRQLQLPDQAAVIALATAKQESDLGADPTAAQPNQDGDAGLFQQRQYRGWYGTLAQVTDPVYATRAFFQGVDTATTGGDGSHIPGLLDIDGWQSLPLTVAAQRVQRSAFPDAYARWEAPARAWLAAALASGGPPSTATALDPSPLPTASPAATALPARSAPPAAPPPLAAPAGIPDAAGCADAGAVAGSAVVGGGKCVTTPVKVPGEEETAGLTPDARYVAQCVAGFFGAQGVQATTYNGPKYHYPGLAVDVMIPGCPDLAAQCTPAGEALKRQVALWAQRYHAELGVDYLVTKLFDVPGADRIWNVARDPAGQAPGQWRINDGTTSHANHVHVNVYGHAAAGFPGATRTGGAVTGGGIAADPAAGAGGWTTPVRPGGYRLSARFGQAGPMWSSGHHTGLDFAAPAGTPMLAIGPGQVASCGEGGAYGSHLIKIDHGQGVQSWYAHGSACPTVRTVTGGTVIGAVGAEGNVTGPHVHLELRIRGQLTDPATWLTTHGVRP